MTDPHASERDDAPRPEEPGTTPAPAPLPPSQAPLPPDPVAYDSARNAAARNRGLPTPYIPGGDDPDPVRARAEERRYGRLLLVMVAAIVLGGFVLGFIGFFVRAALGL